MGPLLIQCPDYERERVIERRVKTVDIKNYGQVYIKCLRNIIGMPGRCPSYQWQRAYLIKLVDNRLIVIHSSILEVEDDAPRNDEGASIVGRNNLDEKFNKLRIVQLLVMVIVAMFVVGVMYVFT